MTIIKRSLFRCIAVFTLIHLITVFISGCSSRIAVNPTPVDSPSVRSLSSGMEYRIFPGDELDIKFFYNSELNESVIVRSDGRISLQLVGEILTVGLTPAELNTILKEKYAPVLVQPEVTVIVKASTGHKIFVDGEVQKAGYIAVTGPINVRRCIAEAGGLKETARSKEILVIRLQKEKDPLIVAVNIDSVNSGTDFSQDIPLLPYDIVYVPRSPIANADLWVKQYITSLLPIPLVPAISW